MPPKPRFEFHAAAELYFHPIRKTSSADFACRHFDTAAQAIRFAMEKLPAVSLRGVCLQVGKARFDQDGIRVLYESDAFPLSRRGRLLVDTDLLHRHNGSYELPRYYVDLRFSCRDCGRSEVWTAEQQKWWYEVCHESIHRKERRCRACRDAHRQRLAALPPGANLLGEERDRLRALAEKPPTPESLTAIEAALQSKWWSLRIVAIQTLGHWGGPDQIRQLEDLVTAGNACRQTCGKEWLRLFAEISSEKRNCDSSRASPCWASTCWAAVAADAATKALRLHALSSAGDSSATDPAQHPTHRSPHHKA